MATKQNLCLSMEDTFPWGRHVGEQVEDVIEDDPDYFTWIVENDIIELEDEVIDKLCELKVI